jgi:hypothetical protein
VKRAPMNGTRRHFMVRVDCFCARLNDGLAAVAIALVVITCLAAAFQTAETLRTPQGFEIAATT